MTVSIYGLCDPRTGELRYIGKAKDVQARFRQHCCETKSNHGTHKLHWINKLRREGLKPECFVIEEVLVGEWQEAERFWISYYTFIGCKLVNCDNGGFGGNSLTAETRKRISESRRGIVFSESHKRSLSMAHAGKRPSNIAQLVAISKRPKSTAHKAAISAGLMGHSVSDESRRRMSESAKRRWVK